MRKIKKIVTKEHKCPHFNLGTKDAALVIYADGSRKLFIPAGKKDDPICDAAFDIVALAIAMDNHALMQKLRKKVSTEAKRVEKEAKK